MVPTRLQIGVDRAIKLDGLDQQRFGRSILMIWAFVSRPIDQESIKFGLSFCIDTFCDLSRNLTGNRT